MKFWWIQVQLTQQLLSGRTGFLSIFNDFFSGNFKTRGATLRCAISCLSGTTSLHPTLRGRTVWTEAWQRLSRSPMLPRDNRRRPRLPMKKPCIGKYLVAMLLYMCLSYLSVCPSVFLSVGNVRVIRFFLSKV